MKHVFVICGLLVVAIGSASGQGKQPIRVLFIGNSYTEANNLPGMIAALATASGERPLFYVKETPGGQTLQKHWQQGVALKKLRSAKWDLVVLQEQSLTPIARPKEMFEAARLFDAEIKKQGARTLLYLTWARQNQPQAQAALSGSYLSLGAQLQAGVAPAGIAWQNALGVNSKLVLHAPDMSHPTPAGTYLTACVFFASIYGKNPSGLPGKIGGLGDREARALQIVAWQTVQQVNADRLRQALQAAGRWR